MDSGAEDGMILPGSGMGKVSTILTNHVGNGKPSLLDISRGANDGRDDDGAVDDNDFVVAKVCWESTSVTP